MTSTIKILHVERTAQFDRQVAALPPGQKGAIGTCLTRLPELVRTNRWRARTDCYNGSGTMGTLTYGRIGLICRWRADSGTMELLGVGLRKGSTGLVHRIVEPEIEPVAVLAARPAYSPWSF